jgi:hypothetical protein
MSDTYWLTAALLERVEWLNGKNEFTGNKCTKSVKHRYAGPRNAPLVLRAHPEPWRDFEWTQFGECVVSERVISFLAAHLSSGVRFLPVTIRNVPSPYRELIVTEHVIAPRATGIRLRESCDVCGYNDYSPLKNAAALRKVQTKSDLFFVWPLPRLILVSAKLVERFTRLGFTGFAVRPLEDVYSKYDLGYHPGPIEDWLYR